MGFRVQLIAIRGKDAAAVQRDFGVAPTGRHEEIPESPVVGVLLPSGAYLLYVNDEIIPDGGVFARLSQGGSLVACYANETVMCSHTCGWEDGHECWSVLHDCEQGALHLGIHGTPPPEFGPIRDRLFAKQQECEDADFVFDVPVELFVALGGIRYDQDIPGESPDSWEILDRLPRSSGTMISRLKGLVFKAISRSKA